MQENYRKKSYFANLNALIFGLERNKDCNSKINLMMLDLANQYFIQKIISRKENKISKISGISSDILELIKEKNELFNKYLKNKSPVFAALKKLKNRVTFEKEAAKRNF